MTVHNCILLAIDPNSSCFAKTAPNLGPEVTHSALQILISNSTLGSLECVA